MILTKSTVLKFYKRKDIQDAIIEHAQNKEIGLRFGEIFGKRPDLLTYPREIMEIVMKNINSPAWTPQQVVSFHSSEEIWDNPLALGNLSKKELDDLRIGWDLVLDIDCKIMEYSRICAHLIIQFLQYCEVKDISIKFSGNKGFHIGVPFEAFPQQVSGLRTKDLFPEAPKRIAFYIKENIKEELAKKIMEFERGDLARIKEKVHLPMEEMIYYTKEKIPKLNIEKFLEIDTILIAPRHLYRMPYSFHEKSGLVSLPLDPQKILQFEKPHAEPEKATTTFSFLNRNVSGESARRLLLQALDFKVNLEEKKVKVKKDNQFIITSPIKEDFFPPCVRLISNGLEDGKKRAIFIMMNYLGQIGWSKEQIEEYLHKWNTEKNREPLREVYLKGQLLHFKPGERLPPNCDNENYCKGIGVCQPDSFCSRIKNPANYTIFKWKNYLQQKEEEENKPKRGRPKKEKEVRTEEQKKENTE